MMQRYDLRQMLQEIKADEKVFHAKPVLLTQKGIKELREKMGKVRKQGRRSP